MEKQTLTVLKDELAICRMPFNSKFPNWVTDSNFYTVSKTDEELSVVCIQEAVSGDVKCSPGWRAIKVEGPLDFSLAGILSSLLKPLADDGISVFAISTFDTDYMLVKSVDLKKAVDSFIKDGHRFTT